MAGEPETVGSVVRAAALLGHFSADRPVITLADLTAESGLNKPTVHRLMSSFVAAGWVSRDDRGAYRVRMPLFAIGAAALAEADLRSLARDALDALADRFGDTAFLMVPSEAGAVVVDRVEGGNSLQVTGTRIGGVLPFHAAAAPVVMAAYDEATRSRLLSGDAAAYTSATVTDPEELVARLDAVRREGGAISRGDYLAGVSAVAAPVLGRSGELLATVSLGGPAADFAGPAAQERLDAVRDAATRLSETLALLTA